MKKALITGIHRPGRFLSGGAFTGKRVSGLRDQAADKPSGLRQRRAFGRQGGIHLCGYDGHVLADARGIHRAAGRGVQPRSAVLRPDLMGAAGPHRADGRDGRTLHAGGNPADEAGREVLSGLDERDVRAGTGDYRRRRPPRSIREARMASRSCTDTGSRSTTARASASSRAPVYCSTTSRSGAGWSS